jgi:type II secretory pathway component PulF
MVQRSVSVSTENKLSVDNEIIGTKSKKDLKKILESMQKKYDTGFPLSKICVKLYEYFNWKYFEYYPVEETRNKWEYLLRYYEKFGNKRSATYNQTVSLLKHMIRSFDGETKEEL